MTRIDDRIYDLVKATQRVVVIALMLLLMGVVFFATIELFLLLVERLFDSVEGVLFIDISELLDLFSFFFLILIGIELLETVELYIKEDTVHAEIVLLVAVIAVSRKVIVLDLEKYEPMTIVGLAALILSLAGGYFLIKSRPPTPRAARD